MKNGNQNLFWKGTKRGQDRGRGRGGTAPGRGRGKGKGGTAPGRGRGRGIVRSETQHFRHDQDQGLGYVGPSGDAPAWKGAHQFGQESLLGRNDGMWAGQYMATGQDFDNDNRSDSVDVNVIRQPGFGFSSSNKLRRFNDVEAFGQYNSETGGNKFHDESNSTQFRFGIGGGVSRDRGRPSVYDCDDVLDRGEGDIRDRGLPSLYDHDHDRELFRFNREPDRLEMEVRGDRNFERDNMNFMSGSSSFRDSDQSRHNTLGRSLRRPMVSDTQYDHSKMEDVDFDQSRSVDKHFFGNSCSFIRDSDQSVHNQFDRARNLKRPMISDAQYDHSIPEGYSHIDVDQSWQRPGFSNADMIKRQRMQNMADLNTQKTMSEETIQRDAQGNIYVFKKQLTKVILAEHGADETNDDRPKMSGFSQGNVNFNSNRMQDFNFDGNPFERGFNPSTGRHFGTETFKPHRFIGPRPPLFNEHQNNPRFSKKQKNPLSTKDKIIINRFMGPRPPILNEHGRMPAKDKRELKLLVKKSQVAASEEVAEIYGGKMSEEEKKKWQHGGIYWENNQIRTRLIGMKTQMKGKIKKETPDETLIKLLWPILKLWRGAASKTIFNRCLEFSEIPLKVSIKYKEIDIYGKEIIGGSIWQGSLYLGKLLIATCEKRRKNKLDQALFKMVQDCARDGRDVTKICMKGPQHAKPDQIVLYQPINETQCGSSGKTKLDFKIKTIKASLLKKDIQNLKDPKECAVAFLENMVNNKTVDFDIHLKQVRYVSEKENGRTLYIKYTIFVDGHGLASGIQTQKHHKESGRHTRFRIFQKIFNLFYYKSEKEIVAVMKAAPYRPVDLEKTTIIKKVHTLQDQEENCSELLTTLIESVPEAFTSKTISDTDKFNRFPNMSNFIQLCFMVNLPLHMKMTKLTQQGEEIIPWEYLDIPTKKDEPSENDHVSQKVEKEQVENETKFKCDVFVDKRHLGTYTDGTQIDAHYGALKDAADELVRCVDGRTVIREFPHVEASVLVGVKEFRPSPMVTKASVKKTVVIKSHYRSNHNNSKNWDAQPEMKYRQLTHLVLFEVMNKLSSMDNKAYKNKRQAAAWAILETSMTRCGCLISASITTVCDKPLLFKCVFEVNRVPVFSHLDRNKNKAFHFGAIRLLWELYKHCPVIKIDKTNDPGYQVTHADIEAFSETLTQAEIDTAMLDFPMEAYKELKLWNTLNNPERMLAAYRLHLTRFFEPPTLHMYNYASVSPDMDGEARAVLRSVAHFLGMCVYFRDCTHAKLPGKGILFRVWIRRDPQQLLSQIRASPSQQVAQYSIVPSDELPTDDELSLPHWSTQPEDKHLQFTKAQIEELTPLEDSKLDPEHLKEKPVGQAGVGWEENEDDFALCLLKKANQIKPLRGVGEIKEGNDNCKAFSGSTQKKTEMREHSDDDCMIIDDPVEVISIK